MQKPAARIVIIECLSLPAITPSPRFWKHHKRRDGRKVTIQDGEMYRKKSFAMTQPSHLGI